MILVDVDDIDLEHHLQPVVRTGLVAQHVQCKAAFGQFHLAVQCLPISDSACRGLCFNEDFLYFLCAGLCHVPRQKKWTCQSSAP